MRVMATDTKQETSLPFGLCVWSTGIAVVAVVVVCLLFVCFVVAFVLFHDVQFAELFSCASLFFLWLFDLIAFRSCCSLCLGIGPAPLVKQLQQSLKTVQTNSRCVTQTSNDTKAHKQQSEQNTNKRFERVVNSLRY